MIDALKFVQGAIARKEFVPALTHFRIEKGKVLGHNGSIALCSPIKLDLECSPKAKPFVKAIEGSTDTVQLVLTDKGRLSVKSGAFSALIECSQDPYPPIAPEGPEYSIPSGIIAALRQLSPFIAEDASRPWAQGILIKGQSAFATNNIVLLERWIGNGVDTFPTINIPKDAVTEILRIGEDPAKIQIGESSITFHFKGNRWLRCQLLTTDWPDVGGLLDGLPGKALPVPQHLFEGLAQVQPFIDDLERVYLRDGKVATANDDNSGASVALAASVSKGVYNLKQLLLLKGVATDICFDEYPSPALFYGDQLRGCIVGMAS